MSRAQGGDSIISVEKAEIGRYAFSCHTRHMERGGGVRFRIWLEILFGSSSFHSSDLLMSVTLDAAKSEEFRLQVRDAFSAVNQCTAFDTTELCNRGTTHSKGDDGPTLLVSPP
jgi:hypothetical protein